jgi:hypothetical protein
MLFYLLLLLLRRYRRIFSFKIFYSFLVFAHLNHISNPPLKASFTLMFLDPFFTSVPKKHYFKNLYYL